MRFRLLAAAAVVTVVVVGGPTPAGAASSVESGWWTSAPVALAPDVGDDQLLVQGGVDPAAPVAFAGISFTLADDEVPETLVLAVAPGSGSTPASTLSLCALGSQATPSNGDAADSGPPYDCATKVDAGPAADGASYEFDVAALVGDGALDVAVLPTSPTDRVVLNKPSVDALQGGAATTSVSDGGFSDGGFSDGGFSDGGTSGGDALEPGDLSLGDVGGDVGSSFDLPAAPAPQPAAAPAANDTGEATERLAAPAAATQGAPGDDDGRSVAPFVFGGLAIAAAVLWTLAGQVSPETAVETGDA